jgi:hypothetical protein
MAKSSKVSSSKKLIDPTNSSLDGVEGVKVKVEVIELDKFLANMKGETKKAC